MKIAMMRMFWIYSVLICGATALVGGCGSRKADLEVKSLVSDAGIRPEFPVRVYMPTDRNTCDVYLSDIPQSRLADLSDPLNDIAGNIVHLHIFLMPEAGQTPIDASACNITVRHVVLTGSQVEGGATGAGMAAGLYAGGGFCLPESDAGDSEFEGSVRDATLRLARATAGFADRLGAARLWGTFVAPRNDDLARAISARIEGLSRSMSEVRKE